MSKNIFNSKNYEKTIHKKDISLFILCYNKIINNFLETAIENIKVNDKKYFIYLILKGIETIQNVFSFLLLYTKNIDLITLHCEKSYLYFIEFIGQIGTDSTAYLQLNCKDAILFVYKKTIYDINNDFKKEFEVSNDQKKLFDTINLLIQCIEVYRTYFINNIDIFESKENKINVIKDCIISFSNKLVYIIKFFNTEHSLEKLKICYEFLQNFDIKNIDIVLYSSLAEALCKKLQKKQKTIPVKSNKFLHIDFEKNIKTMTANKFLQWLSL